MKTKDLHDIIITDDDIDWVEKIMGPNISFDTERRAVIKCMESIDVQACPGSGKTTALVAKLAILARKWPYDDFGICVLSHTNVAREEIQTCLGNYEIGKRLLSYPHFIGTVQKFVDSYLAIPWLKSNDYPVSRVDTAYVLSKRWNMQSDYIRQYLKDRNLSEKVLCYVNNIDEFDKKVASGFKKFLRRQIQKSQRDGYFTYDEMLLYVKQLLETYPLISNVITKKFPIVFIDESQDISNLQWTVLDMAFKDREGFAVQTFGDINQDIYENERDVKREDVNQKEQLRISNSRRFNECIAKLANTVAFDNEVIKGVNQEFVDRDIKNTVFLFSKDKISEVIDAFGELVTNTFSKEELVKYKNYGCHAIGQIHKKTESITYDKLPKSVADYWISYDDKGSNLNKQSDNLIGFFRKGLRDFQETKEMGAYFNELFLGLRALNSLFPNEVRATITGKNFTSSISAFDEKTQQSILRILSKLSNFDSIDKSNWNDVCCKFIQLLIDYGLKTDKTSFEKDYAVNRFLEWEEDRSSLSLEIPEKLNVYHYVNPKNDVDIDIELGSIHSVKGRTHLATLVLETFYHKHNITSILPYLTEPLKKRDECNTYNIHRLKCQYVAMTRPKALVCIALPIENISDSQIQKLQHLGWHIKNIV